MRYFHRILNNKATDNANQINGVINSSLSKTERLIIFIILIISIYLRVGTRRQNEYILWRSTHHNYQILYSIGQ